MRRITFCLLAWMLAVLPVFAQADDGLRIRRGGDFNSISEPVRDAGSNGHSGWDESFSEQFRQSPPQSSNPGFVLDIQAAPQRQPAPGFAPSLQRAAGAFIKQLGPRELNLLSSRDVIVLIDKSGSMGDKDCPAPETGLRFLSRAGEPGAEVSRWDWCENELMSMSQLASGALRQGMRVVLFSNDQTTFDRVRLNQIPQIFRRHYPAGNTNAAAAVKAQLDWYFGNKAMHHERARPVVIAVITDGLPNNVRALKKAIIEATHAMQRPDEIAITFLQVGRDRKGINLVHELDDDLLAQGAVFDIVDCKDFSDLLQVGLGRALADAINETGHVARRNY